MTGLRQWLRLMLPGVLLGAGIVTAGAAPYSEPLERSTWQLTEDDDTCRIEQSVRHGGTLGFETRPGLVTGAYWEEPYPMPEGHSPRLRTGAPEWLRPASMAPLDLQLEARDDRIFRVPQSLVQPLKARLLAGHDIRIDFPDRDDWVHFRGIRFALRAQDFRACYGSHTRPAAAPEAGALERWSVYFDTGLHRLDHEARETLEVSAQALASVAAPRVRVVGWTDAEGPLGINEALSRDRARVVREALVEAGVAAEHIEIEAPGVDPAAEGARAASRRSDIWWLKGDREADEAPAEAVSDPRAEPPAGPVPIPPGPSETPAW